MLYNSIPYCFLYFPCSQTDYIPRPVAEAGEVVHEVWNTVLCGWITGGKDSLSGGGEDSGGHAEKGAGEAKDGS